MIYCTLFVFISFSIYFTKIGSEFIAQPIVGANLGNQEDLKYQAVIFGRPNNTENYTLFCSAGIIAPNFSLTAAHCFLERPGVLKNISFIVVVDELNLNIHPKFLIAVHKIYTANYDDLFSLNNLAVAKAKNRVPEYQKQVDEIKLVLEKTINATRNNENVTVEMIHNGFITVARHMINDAIKIADFLKNHKRHRSIKNELIGIGMMALDFTIEATESLERELKQRLASYQPDHAITSRKSAKPTTSKEFRIQTISYRAPFILPTFTPTPSDDDKPSDDDTSDNDVLSGRASSHYFASSSGT